jgi:hypothetical protein
MSRYEAYLVRTALIYLVLTGLLGLLLFVRPELMPYFRTTHFHLGFIGFFLGMVMGVAYWMMPRPGGLRQERLEALTFFLLNAGILLRLFAEPAWRISGLKTWYYLTVSASLLQFFAMLVFAFAMWQRIKTRDYILKVRQQK